MLEASVIICTHSPRPAYFARVMDGLGAQTIPPERWELLVIDNASDPALPPGMMPAWHPRARLIVESQLGLGRARLRAIREAAAPILIFVDDDNVLAANYLELALQIGRDWPILGAWGGQAIGEFETPLPGWAEPYIGYLGLRVFEEDVWSNVRFDKRTLPIGAGMCIRREVGEKFAEIAAASHPRRLGFDRSGSNLFGANDTDLGLTVGDLGLGSGAFRELKLTHLIPSVRLTEPYFLRLLEDLAYSQTWVEFFRGFPERIKCRSDRLLRSYQLFWAEPRSRRFTLAEIRGVEKAQREIAAHRASLAPAVHGGNGTASHLAEGAHDRNGATPRQWLRTARQFCQLDWGDKPVTPGRIAYLLGEKFGHGLKTAYFRDVIRPRILDTPPLTGLRDKTCEVHVLTSSADWLNLAWALKSFYAVAERRFALCLHDDGTLEEPGLRQLANAFPDARIITRAEADSRLDELLSIYPRSRAFRADNRLALKVFDFVSFLESDRMMVLDSDILFFRRPEVLLDALEDPSVTYNTLNKDWGPGYTFDPVAVADQLGFHCPPQINSGLGLIHKASMRLDWIEEFLTLPGILGHPHQIEQTLIALCSAKFGGFRMLPPEYDVRLDDAAPDAPSRHYTGPIRHLMYSEGMRRLHEDGFLQRIASFGPRTVAGAIRGRPVPS